MVFQEIVSAMVLIDYGLCVCDKYKTVMRKTLMKISHYVHGEWIRL